MAVLVIVSAGIGLVAGAGLPALALRLVEGAPDALEGPRVAPVVSALALGTLFGAWAVELGDEPAAGAALGGFAFLAALTAAALADIEARLVPNPIVAVGSLVALALVVSFDGGELTKRLISAAAAGGVLLIASLVSPAGMGMGDAKLAGMMGLYLGPAVAPALLAGFVAGAIYGAVLIVARGPGARRQGLPFAPFLAAGGVVGLLAGCDLVDAYLDAVG